MASHKPSPLKAENVTVVYERARGIQNVSFEVSAGEIFGLIGLNGAGKTTFIKASLGLRTYEKGGITSFGQVAGSDAAKRDCAFLPERFDPPWFLSAIEFLEFSLGLYQQRLDIDKVDRVALGRRVQTFSKGMRQKLGLMATVLTNCPLLILDEPMSGLDPRARIQVKGAMLEAKAQGRTVFFSSHILADMEELCDRVAIIHLGDLRYIGRPQDLTHQTGAETLERAFLALIEDGTEQSRAA
jgi:ABC-2 type transport system ATP-binding protein